MAQYEMTLREYWLIVVRRRVTIIACTLLVAFFSFWFARQKAPVYEATAAVKYEPSTALSGLLVEVLSYSSADSIETQAALVKSYPILEEVARRLGRLPEAAPGEPARESKAYVAALDALASRVRITRVPGTAILEITATSSNPAEARDLANTVAEAYRDYNRAQRNARITEARKFIEAQVREVEARLKKAEEEVWAFREANRIIAPGAESSVLLSLFTQLRGDIERTRQQRTELELAQRRLAQADLGPNDRVFVDSSNPALQRLQATQVELLLERNNLALEVTEEHPRLQALDDRIREVRAEMRREVAAQIALLRSREEILNRQMGELLQKNREVPAIELGLARLQRDAKVNDDLLTLLKTRHQEALIKESESVEEVSIVQPATEPGAPVGTETLNTVIVGALLGLLLGLIVAFVQETMDTSIGTIEDVETYLQVPVLGIVPHIDAREAVQRLVARRPSLAGLDPDALQAHALLITHFDPKSPVAEAYRTLRTNVQFMRMERQGKVLVVTSPTLQEGKTTTIVNLALSMAQNGQRTLLVGANLRRPSIHRFFGIEREPGLSDVLVGNARWQDCIRTVADILMGRFEMEDIMASPGLDNLHIIESGPVPANPSELLSTPAMARFLREVREEYDIVLIDTPPVLPVTDSAIVAAQVDGVILVYQAGKVGRLVLKRAKAHLEAARAQVWGVVLNDVQAEIAGYAYSHYYTHYYGEEAPGEAAAGPLGRAWQALRRGWRGQRAAVAGSEEPERSVEEVAAPVISGQRQRVRTWRRPLLVGLLVVVALLAALALVLWLGGWPTGVTPRPLSREPDMPPAPVAGPETARPPAASLETATASPPRREEPASPPPAAVPDRPASPPPGAGEGESAAPAPTAAASPAPRSPAPAPRSAPVAPRQRFAVEFGPFMVAAEADRVERELTHAGYQTVRFRLGTDAALYAVLVEPLPTRADAERLLAALREEGFPEAVIQPGEPLAVQVGELSPLRGAVQLGERLRERGHPVRIAARPGQAASFVIRHGNFTSRREAEATARELARLGLPNHVVRVR